MTLVRLNNRDYMPARRSYRGMEDMFNWLPAQSGCNSYPSANIIETDDDFKIEMLVPGYSKEDISIEYENSLLSVSHESENKEESEGDDSLAKYVTREFHKRNFHRRFKLSDRLASDKITARYENGILEISIPKKEEAKAKPVREISID